MSTKLYIGSEQADFNEAFNVQFSIGDVRNFSFGNANRSYSLNLPHTKTNLRLLKHIQQADVTSEPNVRGWLFCGEQLIIFGSVKITGYSDHTTRIVIDADEWIDSKKDVKLSALDFSASNHVLNVTNVEDSWSTTYPVYRYPMIDFGGLQSGEAGTTAKWWPTDFIPMVSVKSIIEKIIAPYTISSTWLSSRLVKDLFILGRETILPESFLKNKAFSIVPPGSHDNDHTGNIPANDYFNVAATFALVGTEVDEGGNYDSDQYVVPESGTYRFSLVVKGNTNETSLTGLTVTTREFTISIKKNGTVIKTATSATISDTLSIEALEYCAASDVITGEIYLNISGSSTSGDAQTLYLGVETGSFACIIGSASRYPGIGQTIVVSDLLPDMTQLDFLAAIRDIFNLRFWTDKRRQVVYIEPWDQFLSSTVIDLTEFIDHEEHPAELISSSYNKTIVFRWKNDESDAAYKNYLKANTDGPGKKELVLSSIYAKEDIGYVNHPFSTVVMGYNQSITNYTVQLPRIYNEMPLYPYIMFDRKTGFNTRLVEWKGLTAGLSWNYNGTTKNTYPKILGLDWTAIYTAYWMKFIHYIDKGKLYTFKMKIKPGMLAQFITVVDTASSEAFRPTYKIPIKGVDHYFFMQKYTTDGNMCEVEMVLKQ